ncbi:MAG: PIN domain-containing protein [Dehalococcoidia bacterium]
MGPGLTAAVADSNIIVDALNGHGSAFETIDGLAECAISRVTWIEVLAGCRTPAEDTVARQLLSTLTVIEVTPQIAEHAVALRREFRLKLPDALILATARDRDVPLVTRNTRDFPADDPTIRVPYRL